jgi:kynurenine formamidase
MKRTTWCAVVVAASLIPVLRPFAQAPAAAPLSVPRDTFNAWMTRLSNAGRWGAQDELGTLNLITAEKRRVAAQSVRDGISISLASDLVAGPDPNAWLPFHLRVAVFPLDSTTSAAIDTITLFAHGYAFSHVDALSHFVYQDRLYNGFARDQLAPEGARKLGIEVMQAGIVTRGVIVDIPRLKGVEYLQPGLAVTAGDLEQWERQHRMRIEAGDVVLIRTGRAARTEATGPWLVRNDASGPHPSLALWLKERGVAALGSDVANEASPSVVPGVPRPMHLLAIVAMGMPLMDNLNLEQLAREAASRSRPTFLFFAAPLRIRGGTGSPVNPLALF